MYRKYQSNYQKKYVLQITLAVAWKQHIFLLVLVGKKKEKKAIETLWLQEHISLKHVSSHKVWWLHINEKRFLSANW